MSAQDVVPEWALEYDDPVIVARRGATSFHEPDFTADEPKPACRYGNRTVVGSTRTEAEWHVRERGRAVGWKDKCGYCARDD